VKASEGWEGFLLVLRFKCHGRKPVGIYYSVLFEDPDGIRLEMNHVPGQGLLAEGVSMQPSGYR